LRIGGAFAFSRQATMGKDMRGNPWGAYFDDGRASQRRRVEPTRD